MDRSLLDTTSASTSEWPNEKGCGLTKKIVSSRNNDNCLDSSLLLFDDVLREREQRNRKCEVLSS